MKDSIELPTTYKGRDYSKAIDQAIQRARTEYLYPTSPIGNWMSEISGRKYYADLIADEICRTNIPNHLKLQLMGKEKFAACVRSKQ